MNLTKLIQGQREKFLKDFVHKDERTLLEPLNAIELIHHNTISQKELLQGVIEMMDTESVPAEDCKNIKVIPLSKIQNILKKVIKEI